MESPSVATLKQSRRGGLIQRDDPGYVDPWTRCRLVRENFSGISFGPLALREMLCYISQRPAGCPSNGGKYRVEDVTEAAVQRCIAQIC